MILVYLLSELQVDLQSGHLSLQGDKLCLPIEKRPPYVVVNAGSVCVLVQCKLQNLVNGKKGGWDIALLMGILLASHVLDKLGVLADLKGAPQNF